MKLILASGSPRRRDLLTFLGFDFEIVPSGVDEEAVTRSRPETLARTLARAKASDVAASHPDAVVVGADTVVVQRGVLLAKPADADEARAMLARLRGRPHRVITGVCVIAPGGRARVAHEVTRVVMREYAPEEVEASIESGEPFDKAGGYALQDSVLKPVAFYQGCYCNVVGLPLWTTLRLLQEAGMSPPKGSQMPLVCDGCAIKPQGPRT